MKNKYVLYSFLALLTIVSLNFLYATFLPETFKIFRILFLSILIGLGFYNMFITNKGFALPIQLLSLTILFSIFISYLTYDQSMLFGYLITFTVLLWPIFFLLLKMKIPIPKIEDVVLFYGILYCILYFYQYANPTNVMFNIGMVEDEFKESQFGGIIRVVFPAAGIFWLTVYIAACRITGNYSYKWLWLIIVFLGLLIPAMQQLRAFLVPTLLVFIYHFGKNISVPKKMIIGVALVFSALFLTDANNPIIQGLLEKQQKTIDSGQKDIRVIAATYFLFEFSPTPINRILGNGMGHQQESYGRYLKSLQEKGLHTSDVGIIGVYAYFGILPIIAWIMIGYKVFTIPIPKKYIYVKYYFVNVLFGALTGSTLYHVNFLISNIFALYIFQMVIEKRNTFFTLKLIQIKEFLTKKKLELKDITLQ